MRLDTRLALETDVRSRFLVWAIKANENALLDVARTAYEERNQEIIELKMEMAQAHNLTLTLGFNAACGYFFKTSRAEVEEHPLPNVFTNERNSGQKSVEFSCLALKQLNSVRLPSRVT